MTWLIHTSHVSRQFSKSAAWTAWTGTGGRQEPKDRSRQEQSWWAGWQAGGPAARRPCSAVQCSAVQCSAVRTVIRMESIQEAAMVDWRVDRDKIGMFSNPAMLSANVHYHQISK